MSSPLVRGPHRIRSACAAIVAVAILAGAAVPANAFVVQPHLFGLLPATELELDVAPSTLIADGASTATATATVRDEGGEPAIGDQVEFTSTDPAQQIGAVADNGDGTYSAEITASTTIGTATITATDVSSASTPSSSAALTQTVGPASAASLALTPESIRADGAATSTATATLSDAEGHPIVGDQVEFTSTDSGQGIGAVTNNGDGTYTVQITASTALGTATITASDISGGASASATKTLTQTVGPAAVGSLSLAPTSIAADGFSTTTATATLTDAGGHPISGDAVAFSSTDPSQQIGTVTDHGNGTYSAVVTASTTVGTAAITATDTSPGATATAGATLTQTIAPATSLSLALAPGSIVADGAATSTATATVTDAGGHPIVGDTVAFSSTDPSQQIGTVTDNGDGTYSAQITASTTVGTATITATDTSPAAAATATASQTLTQSAAPTPQIALALAPKSILANGTAASVASATLFDTQGHSISGAHVTFTSTDPKQKIGAVTDNGNGIYTAFITASTTPGTATITATDTDASPDLKATATLTQSAVPAPPKSTTKPPPAVLETLPTPPVLPLTVFTLKPLKHGRDRTPTFAFASDAPGATFICAVGARPPRSCSSPLTLPRLAFGSHVFAVYSTDSAGRVGAPVSYRFAVERRRRQAAKPRSGASGARSHR